MPRKKTELAQAKPGSMLKYLQNASPAMLHNFELSRLNHVSNMRKELQVLVDQMVNDMSEALLARALLNHRKEIVERPKRLALTVDDLISEIAVQSTNLPTVGKKAK